MNRCSLCLIAIPIGDVCPDCATIRALDQSCASHGGPRQMAARLLSYHLANVARAGGNVTRVRAHCPHAFPTKETT